MEEFTQNAKKVGIRIFGCFMIGIPGESRGTIKQTFAFAKKLNPDMVFFQTATPFPGTEFYDYCKEKEYLATEDFSKWIDSHGQLDCVINLPDLKREEIRKTCDKLTIGFYLSHRYIIHTLRHSLNHEEVKRLFKSMLEYGAYLLKKLS